MAFMFRHAAPTIKFATHFRAEFNFILRMLLAVELFGVNSKVIIQFKASFSFLSLSSEMLASSCHFMSIFSTCLTMDSKVTSTARTISRRIYSGLLLTHSCKIHHATSVSSSNCIIFCPAGSILRVLLVRAIITVEPSLSTFTEVLWQVILKRTSSNILKQASLVESMSENSILFTVIS